MANTIAFDEQFYLQQYPDVAAAVSRGLVASGAEHYEKFGRFESRNPNAFFNTSFYLGEYPDVARAGVNPLTHFLNFGANENRITNANAESVIDKDGNGFANEFNATAYLTANPDVASAVQAGQTTAYKHFIEFGQFEGRSATLTDGTVITGPIANAGTGANPGSTLTFTTNIDALTGTAANDTFVGDAATLTAADSVNGGAGTDTVNIFGPVANQPLPQMTSIENLIFTAPNGFSGANVSGITGLTNVGLANTTAGSLFTINANQGVSYSNVTGAPTETVVTTATDTAVTVTLANSALGTLNVDGAAVTTINLASTGTAANSVAALASTGTETTVNITGTQALTITGALADSVTKVDASGNSAGVNVTVGTSAISVIGGAGNDKFVFAGTLTTADSVVGGAGTDTVTITGVDLANAANVAQLNALNTKVTGVEVLEFNGTTAATIQGGTATGSFTNAEITKILFNTADAGVDTINSAGATRTYAFGELNTGTAVLNGTAGVTSFNVSLEGITGNGGNVGALTANFTNTGATQVGTGTINIASIGTNDAANVNSTGVITGQSNGAALTATNVVVTGSHDLTIAGLNTAGSINASAFTGKLVATGSTGQDVIVGGAGADTINATAGGDTYTGGAGADTFVFGNVNQASRATLTTISDFVSGTDKLDVNGINGAGTVFNATAINVTAAPDFTGALNLAASATAAGTTSYFQFNGDTYVVVDNDAATNAFTAADAVVKLTGLVTLTASDVVVA